MTGFLKGKRVNHNRKPYINKSFAQNRKNMRKYVILSLCFCHLSFSAISEQSQKTSLPNNLPHTTEKEKLEKSNHYKKTLNDNDNVRENNSSDDMSATKRDQRLVVARTKEHWLHFWDYANVNSLYLEYFPLLEKYLNRDLEYLYFDNLEEVKLSVIEGRSDLAFGFIENKNLDKSILFSNPTVQQDYYLWYHDESARAMPPSTLKWGCIQGSYLCDDLKKINSNPVNVLSTPAALIHALSQNNIQATLINADIINNYLDSITAGEWIGETKIFNNQSLAFISSWKNHKLINSVNQFLDIYPIQNNVSPGYQYFDLLHNPLALESVSEQLQRKTVRYSIEEDLFPLSYKDTQSGKIIGYMHELMEIYSRKSGLKFEYIPKNEKSFEEMLKSNEIDIYPMSHSRFIQSKHFLVTKPIFEKQWAKVRSHLFLGDNNIIGVLDHTKRIFNYINTNDVSHQLKLYENLQSIEHAIKQGEISFAYLPKSVAHYYLYYSSNHGFSVVNESEEDQLNLEMVLIAEQDSPLLVEMLNLAITNTTSHERDLAMQKHQMVTAQFGYKKDIVNNLAIVAFFILLVLALFVRRRYSSIASLINRKELQLKVSSEQLTLLNGIIESFPGMIAILDDNQKMLVANNEFKRCFNGCVANGCTKNTTCCGFIDVVMDENSTYQEDHIAISKPICPIDGKYYQIHQEKVTSKDNLRFFRLLIFTDCTTLQQQQEQLKIAKLAALKQVQERESFLAMVSHELRTPLAAIMGLLELLNPEIKQLQNRELFLSAQKSAGRLNILVNNLLDFSKMEADQMQLDAIEGNLFRELGPLLRTFEAMSKNKKIDFFVNWTPCTLAIAHFDWLRLCQVLNNLINNAIKFTDTGYVSISIYQNASELVLSVRDSGCGMTPDQLEKIYVPFAQAEQSIARRYGGTGLGMPIVKTLVELMLGKITLESQLGVGTFALIRIPATFSNMVVSCNETVMTEDPQVQSWLHTFNVETTQSTGDQPPMVRMIENHYDNIYPDLLLDQLTCASSNVELTPNRELATHYQGIVLAVDDDPINRLLFKKQLNKLGIEHICLPDGKAAFDYLQDNGDSVQLLITDCHMPLMSGYDLTLAIRANPKLKELPIVGCTAEDSRIVAQRANSVGMNSVIYKPYTLEILLKVIATHCQVQEEDPNQASLYDMAWLNQFDPDDQSEIANTVITSMQDESHRLCEHGANVKQIAHRIKGSAALLGLDSLAERARHCEEATTEQAMLCKKKMMAEIRQLLHATTQWINHKDENK